MNIKHAIAAVAVTFGLCVGNVVLTPRTALASPADYAQLRSVVDRSQKDLQDTLALQAGGSDKKQSKRYVEAQKALSDFDKKLAKGHFDKGKLDKSVDKLKDVLDHNTLQASSRDSLMHDMEDLRIARDQTH